MAKKERKQQMIWAYLLHLGYNFWSDRKCPEWDITHVTATAALRHNRRLWEDILAMLAEAGMNMVVIDLGEGVRYKSHPEIASRGAWTTKKLRKGLKRIRKMGLEPIPKLNFSTAHDAWMGPWSRCVSTRPYYKVCRDLIKEVTDLFDGPRFFHLGMDEETAAHQKHYGYAVMRQHELWWQDLAFYVHQVEKRGARPWVWSDYVWHHPDEFYTHMPASVLQSNWYYGSSFENDQVGAATYKGLESHGYDQVPTGSNWSCPENFPRTVDYARQHVAPERLLGFLQTVWRPTVEECREKHTDAIRIAAQSRSDWDAEPGS